MIKNKFKKTALNINEKITFLKNKWLIFNDEKNEKVELNHIWYFRLSWYLKYFQKNDSYFFEWTTFKKVVDLYNFDRELRLLTIDVIEKIEISLKAHINDYMSEKFEIFWYLDEKLFLLNTDKKREIYTKLLLKINNIKQKSGSIFIKHYFEKYDEENLPSWMLFEELTIWELSNIFRLLKNEYKQKIADNYWVYQLDLQIWLHLLVNIRNISAHHWRLWNKEYNIKPRIKDRLLWKKYQTFVVNSNKWNEIIPNYYNLVIFVNYLLKNIDKNFLFINYLEKLFLDFPLIDKQKMWFNKKWIENFK